MKKFFAFWAVVIMALGLTACGGKLEDVPIDYGTSEIYSQSDMDEAINLIKREFAVWEGCELHRISYTSDECNSEENIAWMNDLGGENSEFTQCIAFVMDFHSPKTDAGAWNPDQEYTNWQWWLARTDSGTWQLMTSGY